MIIFAVQTNVVLSLKPKWLDSFVNKYDPQHEPHVTLKQVCIISEDEIQAIKDKFYKYLENENIKPIHIVFNKLILESPKLNEEEACIMIQAENNNEINKLQKNIINTLNDYNNYYRSETKRYEEEFRPHLTIAMNLNKDRYIQSVKDLGDDCIVEGDITKVMLTIVYDFNPTDQTKSRRKDFVYFLKN